MSVNLRDRLFSDTGGVVQGATVQAILVTGGGTDAGTGSSVSATTTTDVNGVWKFTALADPGAGNWYDVKITNGNQIRWRYGNIQSLISQILLTAAPTFTGLVTATGGITASAGTVNFAGATVNPNLTTLSTAGPATALTAGLWNDLPGSIVTVTVAGNYLVIGNAQYITGANASVSTFGFATGASDSGGSGLLAVAYNSNVPAGMGTGQPGVLQMNVINLAASTYKIQAFSSVASTQCAAQVFLVRVR